MILRKWRRVLQGAAIALTLASFAGLEERCSLPDALAEEAPPKQEWIYADAFLVWIYDKPRRNRTPIGYLRAGQRARRRRGSNGTPIVPLRGKNCRGKWYAIEPKGFLCVDHRASTQPTRYWTSMKSLLPAKGAYPFSYVLSMGARSYRRLPTQEEWLTQEAFFGKPRIRPLPRHWRGHDQLITKSPLSSSQPAAAVPDFLNDQGSVARSTEERLVRRDVPFGSMLAIHSTFQANGRDWLMSADGTIVPMERMRSFRPSEFEGVDLRQEGLSLPLAWAKTPTPHYQFREEKGTTSQSLTEFSSAPREKILLSGQTKRWRSKTWYQTNEGTWVAEQNLYLAREEKPPPRIKRRMNGVGSTQEKGSHTDKSQDWIHFSIGSGTLVTYEGTEPTFATLASPGMGGQPRRGVSSLEGRTTPLGTFEIQFKHRSDDMSPEVGEHRKYWIADVPHAMYFSPPFAIHVAYWHENFGEPMSGGCINVSPKDGARLFVWTSPPLPEGWYGVGASSEFGRGTVIKITR
ncbi:MAG: L,D-transpeptidase [Polyangiaceae bacterium]|nr:L,D-transpeptidase [Polyangiaceae bacterium]